MVDALVLVLLRELRADELDELEGFLLVDTLAPAFLREVRTVVAVEVAGREVEVLLFTVLVFARASEALRRDDMFETK